MAEIDHTDSRPSRRAGRRRPAAAVLLAALGAASAACVSVQPLTELRSDAPGRLVTVDGLEIYVEEHGDGEPLFLVHGFGGSTYSWRRVIPSLASEFRVIAVDLVGFGLSDRPPEAERYSRPAQVSMLLALADELGVDSAHWAGHSYGGGLVATLAGRAPERARSLVLVDSTAPDYAEKRRGIQGSAVVAWPFLRLVALRPSYARRSLERSYWDDSLVDRRLVDAYLDRLRVEGVVRAYIGLSRPQPDPGPEWRVELEGVTAPTLLVWGEHDRLIGLDSARRALARLPNARLVALPECGHIPLEEAPERLAAEMLRFLRMQSSGEPPTGSRPL